MAQNPLIDASYGSTGGPLIDLVVIVLAEAAIMTCVGLLAFNLGRFHARKALDAYNAPKNRIRWHL